MHRLPGRALRRRAGVIDSVQVVHCEDVPSAPGGVAQVRESAAQFTRFSKAGGGAMFLVGHVTKDGTLAGPKVLELNSSPGFEGLEAATKRDIAGDIVRHALAVAAQRRG